MADVFSKLFQIYRTLYAETSNGFHPAETQQSIDHSLDSFAGLMREADAIPSGGGSGLMLQLDAAVGAFSTLLATARTRDTTKILNAAALDQSNYRRLAERQQTADERLLVDLTLLVATIGEKLSEADGDGIAPETLLREAGAVERALAEGAHPESRELADRLADESGVDSPEDEA